LFSGNFSFGFWDLKELFLLLPSQIQNMSLRGDFTFYLGGDLLHEAYNSIKHGSALDKGRLFFPRTDENKLGVFLAGAAFHLDECLHSEKLI